MSQKIKQWTSLATKNHPASTSDKKRVAFSGTMHYMKKSLLYRLEVAPLVILPLNRSPLFTYASDVPITPGSLVSISFGPQTSEGIVFDCQVLPGPKPHWMKYINRVLEESVVTTDQCTLAEQVSEEYFTPLGKTFKHFLPKKVLSRKKQVFQKRKQLTLRATKEEQHIIKAFLEENPLPRFLDTSLLPDPKKTIALIAKALIKKEQVLIIVPEITLVFGWENMLRDYFSDSETAVLHSKLSPGASFSTWERIRSGEARLILSTRQGLFAPFQKLGAVIVLEEQDESYKQWDMSPRYHGKKVASLLASITQAKLLLVSGTPSVESVYHIQKKLLLPLRPLSEHASITPALTIVNLKLERYRRNFSPLSEALALSLRDAIDRGEQALLYINRQGLNAFSVCESCKSVFRCQKCSHPLGSTKEGTFHCAACGYTTGLFPSCPTCGHLVFRHVGFGTERIEKEVRRLLPHATTARIDSTTLKTAGTLEKVYQDGRHGNIDILIGTQMILKDPPLPKLTLIAMIDADSLLLFPDFQADERLFRDLSRAVRQVAKQHTGRVFVQTFRPEGAFFQKIAEKDSRQMLEHMLTERDELRYPPFFRFLSLLCQGKTEKEVTDTAHSLSAALQKKLPKEYRLSPPRPATFLKKKARYESRILLRFPADTPLTDELRTLLKKSSRECIIDMDPLTLL